MTKALDEAFKEAAKLPPPKQDALAQAILSELRGDEQWDELFAQSRDVLERLADEAMEEHRAGRTQPLDPDRL
jgi:hypothetical protein